MAGRTRIKPARPPETELQARFVKRVREEMGSMSIRELSMRVGAPARRTTTDVLNGGSVPGLTFVHQIATALGVHPWELMVEKAAAESQENQTNVRKLPARYPPIFPEKSHGRTDGKIVHKNKRRA